MLHYTVRRIVAFIVPYFLTIEALTTSIATVKFPSQCQFGKFTITCINKGLRTIPEGIPLTARVINLSRNPQLQIPSDYFLQFKKLTKLDLSGCGLSGPVYLPPSIVYVILDDNFLPFEALRAMLSPKLESIKCFLLRANNLSALETKALLTILPPGLRYLDISYNALIKLTRKDMLQLKDIRVLWVEHCSLENIELGTFDDLRMLRSLKLNGNKLDSLPNDLFRFNLKIAQLQLKYNQLKEFNSTRLGLKLINELRLTGNRIETFDIRNLGSLRVALLDNNKIQKLETNIFHNNSLVLLLFFNNNDIKYISKDAFRGSKTVSQLLLNNNRLTSLPEGLFKGMKIMNLLLQKNKFSTFKGIFHGMECYPYSLLLANNKDVNYFDGRDFQYLPSTSNIYLTCDEVTRFDNLSQLQAKIECSPKADESFHFLSYGGLSCKGYQCKKVKPFSTYKCTACRPGYYNPCPNIEGHNSVCVKCPPGSFYEDEPASIACKKCRPGQFVSPERSPGTDASDCHTCPQGTNTTVLAGTRACPCSDGYSRRYRFGPCLKCTDKGFDCSQDYQVVKDGFWITWQGTFMVDNSNIKQKTCEDNYKLFIKNLNIEDDSYDRGTMHFNCQMPLPIKCPMSKSCVGGTQPKCSPPYTGVLCAVCNIGYTPQFNQCVSCPQSIWAVMQFIGYISAFLILCFIISLTDKIIIENSTNSERKTDSRTLGDVILSSLKILIGFYQILISIVHALSNIDWPGNLKNSINIVQFIQFQIVQLPSLRCMNSKWKIDAVYEFWIILIIIIIFPLLAVLYYFIKSLYIHYQCSSPSERKKKRNICRRNSTKGVALFLFLTYTLISTKIVEILPVSCHSFCTAKQNGTCLHSMSFLRSDYSIACPTMAGRKATLITAYISLIIPLGLPIILMVLLWSYAPRSCTKALIQRNGVLSLSTIDDDEDSSILHDLHASSVTGDSLYGDTLYDDSHPRDSLVCDPTIPTMTSALKFSYENYDSRFWYWEVIELIRKLLMTIGIVIFLKHTEIGLTCTIIVAMTFAILHSIIKPFKNSFEGGAQFLSLILIPLNLAFSAVLQSQDTQRPNMIKKERDSFFLSSWIVIMNSTLVFVLVARIIIIIGRKIWSRRRKSL